MRVSLRFIPGSAAKLLGFSSLEVLDLPDRSSYGSLVKLLDERFKASSSSSGESILDHFMLLIGGEPILKKLDQEIDPREEVKVIMLALGG